MNIRSVFQAAQPVGTHDSFAADLIAGLTARPKTLPPKYFYDLAGSALFERITELPEYYPTRCEIAILRGHAAAIAAMFPPGAALIEFGSGSSRKARILLAAAATVAAYVPVDISGDFLQRDLAQLGRDLPHLVVHPLVADFTKTFAMPKELAALPRVGLFPGSTIGNFEPAEAAAFLRHTSDMLGAGGLLLVGVDLVKDEATLYRAYNDAAGVTAKFNLNLLARTNRELGADFDLSAFEHRAFYNAAQRRIEMHLVSKKAQRVRINGIDIGFGRGETIHTENSYKYTVESFQALARDAGWTPAKVFSDGLFAVHALKNSGIRN
jgi:L-histidine Nalpha-methyltransferase